MPIALAVALGVLPHTTVYDFRNLRVATLVVSASVGNLERFYLYSRDIRGIKRNSFTSPVVLDQTHRIHSGPQKLLARVCPHVEVSGIVLDVDLSPDQLKEIGKALVASAAPDEVMSSASIGGSGLSIVTKYSELDHGATRLKQRRQREAELSIVKENGKTIIRLPATEKARGLAAGFVGEVERILKKEVAKEEIDLSVFSDPDVRTSFFTKLITSLPDSKLENVLRIKVERNANISLGSESDEEDEKEDAKEEMLSVVKNVALSGESLLASPEYQSLKKRGFYITSVKWRVRTKPPSGPVVEFEAGFDDPEGCKGFRYAVKHWRTQYSTGEDRKTFVAIPEISKNEFGKELEATASGILRDLLAENQKAAEGESE